MTADDEQKSGREPLREPGASSAPARGGTASGGALAGAGFQFAASILLFLFAGRWLDRRLGTSPWLLVTGVAVGAGLGFFAMYRTLMAAQGRGSTRR